MTRYSQWGSPFAMPRSTFTVGHTTPTLGYTNVPTIQAPLGSLVSAQNFVVLDGRLETRGRLARYGTGNPWADEPNGAFAYDDISGTKYPVVTSRGTIAYLDDDNAWSALSYVASGSTNQPPSGGRNDLYFGTSVYLERRDINMAIFTNGFNYPFAWGGPIDGARFSTLTGAPIAKDVALFDNRAVFWNVYEGGAPNRYVTRVQWSVGGGPEDYTGIGSGTDDLVDMRGHGTRIFATEDELLLASTEEIWRGRKIGLPFTFQFQPLLRTIGIPHARAAIQTPYGLFWLDDDDMVRRYAGGGPEEVGAVLQRELHETIADRDRAFFTAHPDTRSLTLWYTTEAGSAPNRAFTLNVGNGTWAPQRTAQRLSIGFSGFAPTSSATTWGALVGSIASQSLTYDQFLGRTGDQTDALASSAGTIYAMAHSATSDDGVAVLHDAQLGAFGADSPHRNKHLAEVRLDLAAESASSLSIAVSPNLGVSFPQETRLALSAASGSSQYKVFLPATGEALTLRVRDDSGGNFAIHGLTMTARLDGDA